MSTSEQRFKAYSDCLIACENCIKTCEINGYIRCLELCRECSELCTLGLRLEAQLAQSVLPFFNLCKKICILCSEECIKHASMHKSCENCFYACKMLLQPELYY